ncbi:hypothetical protein P7C70_g9430, partial [Phenoliferia sp. Uapishka_3]
MQLILRKQLRVMVDDLGFPEDLENVCKDLWTMLMASSGVPAAPVDHEKGDEPAGSFSGPREGMRYHRKGRKKRKAGGDGAEGDDEGEKTQSEGEEEERKKKRREEGADSGSEDEDEEESEEEMGPIEPDVGEDVKATPAGPPRKPHPYDPPKRPPSNKTTTTTEVRDKLRIDFLLIILYLGCVTLRLPVLLKDILE